MPRFAYVNGHYVRHEKACIHIEDRGYQFADGVYEVIACINGRLADERGHFDRLERSLGELGIEMPRPRATISHIMRELLRRNRLREASIYIQISRGVAKRDFPFPAGDVRPALVITARPFRFAAAAAAKMAQGVKAITVPDLRWKRRDIKSTALLPQVLAKEQAAQRGAYEAWMVDDNGFITEGASSNAWIVTKDGVLVTRQADQMILRGVTRSALDRLREDLQIRLEERPFTPEEAYEAEEAFNSSAVALVAPVVELDGHKIGSGRPGPVATRLYEEYINYVNGAGRDQVEWTA